MTRVLRFLRDDGGAAMVEFALVAILVFFPMVFGIVELGRVVFAKTTITAAAREGVRYAIVHGGASGAVADSAAVANYVIGRTKIAPITVRTTWTPNNDPGSKATVEVRYVYAPIVRLIPGRTFKSTSSQGGLKVFDVSKITEPREIAFLPMSGKGIHRMTYFEDPYVYVTGSETGWTDQFLIVVDLSDRSNPREVGRFWMPGMHAAGGERSSLPPGRTSKLHHALVRGDRAYCGWWDEGLVILDVADKTRPTLVSHLDFGADVSGATHSALPEPLLSVTSGLGLPTSSTCVWSPAQFVETSRR